VEAVDQISLTVTSGEFVAILGPSGCGKSTLLYMIAGFIKPSVGQIVVDDRVISGPGRDRGIVFQEYSLFPWLTALDNVAYGLRELGVKPADRRATALRYLRRVGLEQSADLYPRQLSGGMKQRVALARTLVVQPEILLLDEPFAAVDAITREDLQRQLADLMAESRTTAVLVTHSAEEAIFLADRIFVFSSRPARVLEILDVDIPRPRARDELGAHPRYAELLKRISHLLHPRPVAAQ
jgi:NitT/TauT family transport system ATP-binding protein